VAGLTQVLAKEEGKLAQRKKAIDIEMAGVQPLLDAAKKVRKKLRFLFLLSFVVQTAFRPTPQPSRMGAYGCVCVGVDVCGCVGV